MGVPRVPLPCPAAEVHAAIVAHDPAKVGDLYGIDARLLRLVVQSEDRMQVLVDLFDVVLRAGRIPKIWKCAMVTPLLKAGKPAELASSYRPVAITSLLCRTLERVLLRRVEQTIKFSDEQHGFRAGRSCVEPLLEKTLAMIDAFMKRRDGTKMTTLMLAFDFSSAFCRITPERVAEQFVLLGGEQRYAHLLRDFMSGRKLRVRVKNMLSGWRLLDIGVPQGSVLGPLCWSLVCEIVINELRAAIREAATGSGWPRHHAGCAFAGRLQPSHRGCGLAPAPL